MRVGGRRLLATIGAAAVLAVWGCGDDSAPAASGPVLGEIPWPDEETAIYRLLQDGDEIGIGRISVDCSGARGAPSGTCLFVQAFEFPDREITDEVQVAADASTLEPRRVNRTVDGPDGKRTWEVAYEDSEVTVHQRDEDDERTDTLAVPLSSYDTWTDLFLWRTLEFRQGYEVKYLGVVTADFKKPEVITISLEVKGLEEVEVPVGTFSAWRLEIRSGGRTQKAWIEDDEARRLVRYDNTELVFELTE